MRWEKTKKTKKNMTQRGEETKKWLENGIPLYLNKLSRIECRRKKNEYIKLHIGRKEQTIFNRHRLYSDMSSAPPNFRCRHDHMIRSQPYQIHVSQCSAVLSENSNLELNNSISLL